jgi:2-amino-4-hydroxy-6-hydroxymethyldihydropteridine diphosphokinase
VTRKVYIAAGSNVGDREGTVRAAARMLEACCSCIRLSSLYETAPMYVTDQPSFLNAALSASTSLGPEELLDRLHSIESALGRDRSREVRMGPRTLDLDILLFEGLVMDSPRLSIPHPRLTERAFVLVPLLELDSGLADPRTGASLSAALARLGDQGVYSYPRRLYTCPSTSRGHLTAGTPPANPIHEPEGRDA